MITIWHTLVQFMFRLGFGMALAMGITPPRLVTSGYYRIHLWVLMGLNTFAALVVYSRAELFSSWPVPSQVVLTWAVGLAIFSYVGSVLWLYEKPGAGRTLLFLLALASLVAAALATPWSKAATGLGISLAFLDLVSSGLLLGVTMAAMLLGHWYLNTPTMELVPLRRLVALMLAAVLVRAGLCAVGLALHAGSVQVLEPMFWMLIGFRWLSGLLGVTIMAVLTWYTLKVPNPQSATGILYAAVVLTFIGELVSQLLSVNAVYPL